MELPWADQRLAACKACRRWNESKEACSRFRSAKLRPSVGWRMVLRSPPAACPEGRWSAHDLAYPPEPPQSRDPLIISPLSEARRAATAKVREIVGRCDSCDRRAGCIFGNRTHCGRKTMLRVSGFTCPIHGALVPGEPPSGRQALQGR